MDNLDGSTIVEEVEEEEGFQNEVIIYSDSLSSQDQRETSSQNDNAKSLANFLNEYEQQKNLKIEALEKENKKLKKELCKLQQQETKNQINEEAIEKLTNELFNSNEDKFSMRLLQDENGKLKNELFELEQDLSRIQFLENENINLVNQFNEYKRQTSTKINLIEQKSKLLEEELENCKNKRIEDISMVLSESRALKRSIQVLQNNLDEISRKQQ